MPNVSIIVPVYNAESYLDRCLKSLQSQTLKDIEVIAINDGSKDNSLAILHTFASKMKNLQVIDQENKGISATRNLGIRVAQGDYIGFLDSDDYIETEMYEKLYEKALAEQLDLVICDYYQEDAEQEICKRITMPLMKKTSLRENPSFLNTINTSPWNKLYKKEMIQKHHIEFPDKVKYEDVVFVMQTLKHAQAISSIQESLLHYIVHSGSETKVIDKRVYDIFKILDSIHELFEKEGKQPAFHEQLEYFMIRRITIYCLQQIYQKDNISMKFIDDAYAYLEKNYPSWRNNKIFNQNNSFIKQIIKKHKLYTKLTVKLGGMIK